MSAKRKSPGPEEAEGPEPDQEPGAPHPRRTTVFYGHQGAEQTLASAIAGRMHHAWLITGPKGLGKATLAYRAARVLFGARQIGPRPLDVDPADPIARRVAGLAHADLLVLRRSYDGKRLRREISVEDARRLGTFLSRTPAEGGYRVGVVDCVDDLNRNAANALLKGLEEPPDRTVLFLICHAPGAVLPTIRSRCRRLALRPLDEAETAAAATAALGAAPPPELLRLAMGRPGRAAALAAAEAQALMAKLEAALADLGRNGASAFAGLAFAREGDAYGRLSLAVELLRGWIHAGVRAGAAGAPPAPIRADRLAAWAGAWTQLGELEAQALGLNMDAVHAYTRIGAILETAHGPRAGAPP